MKPIAQCRLCQSNKLVTVYDFGQQHLSGQFPLADEPEPSKVPLELVRCGDCGLVQLRHTVEPEAMFSKYHYRTSVSQTMRTHVKNVVEEASEMLTKRDGKVCVAPRVLSIGGNDGYELECIPFPTGIRTMVDPSDIPVEYPGINKIHGFFPDAMLLTQKFDLVMSLACFYASDKPLQFTGAIKHILSPDGLWVCEVSDLFAVLQNVLVDSVCPEHLCYYSAYNMVKVAQACELKVVRVELSDCNGGSARYYMTHKNSDAYVSTPERLAKIGALWTAGRALAEDADRFSQFAKDIDKSFLGLRNYIQHIQAKGGVVHALGASTKLAGFLQMAGVDKTGIVAASDRDPRKVGRRMPGTGIPIISEEESRAAKPMAYVSVLNMFAKEIVARERAAGTTAEISFLLPSIHTVLE